MTKTGKEDVEVWWTNMVTRISCSAGHQRYDVDAGVSAYALSIRCTSFSTARDPKEDMDSALSGGLPRFINS